MDGRAHADLVDLLTAEGLADTVAFVELHNEVQITRLNEAVPAGQDPLLGLRPFMEAAIERFRAGDPGVPVTEFALRDDSHTYPQERVNAELLRPDAPPLEAWQPPPADRWRLDATIVRHREVYTHDWCDPVKWGRWLYERYGEHRRAMAEVLDLWIAASTPSSWPAERVNP